MTVNECFLHYAAGDMTQLNLAKPQINKVIGVTNFDKRGKRTSFKIRQSSVLCWRLK